MAQQVTIGDYILERSLGSGSTGKVRLGRHQLTGEQAAIKIIKKALFKDQPQLLKKVQREIALMRLLDHPCILSLHDVYESAHHIFLVESYAPNGSLYDCIQSLPKHVAISFFRQIVYGLDYLHQHGICHRDLKPENLLLSSANQILIADFGFACWMPNNVAKTPCGSPLYSAPEIIRGVPYDGKMSDVWSAGVILYAMLTGTLPFTGDSVRMIAQRIKKGTYVIPQGLDPSVIDLIRGILVVDPAKRLTVAQIKVHPAFRIGLDPRYVLPTPLPLPRMNEKVELTEADTASIEILQQVGFVDLDELKAQLTADTPNMAKVFFSMLTQTDPILAWQREGVATFASLGHIEPASSESHPIDYGGISHHSSDSLSASLCESFRHAARFPAVPAAAYCDDDVIDGIETHASGLMCLLQQMCRAKGFTFLHPDDRTLIVLAPGGLALYRLRAAYIDEQRMSLDIKLIAPEEKGSFVPFVADLRIALQELVPEAIGALPPI
jgi:BR serine/threonine kinase